MGKPGSEIQTPAVEIYNTTRANVRYRMNHTYLCLRPVDVRATARAARSRRVRT